MNQHINAALAAINKGDKNAAMEFLKQAIAANANDIEAWLVLSAVVGEPERKRQCLNRVLALDPTHRIAREELLKLDRLAMGSSPIPQSPDLIQEKPIQSATLKSTAPMPVQPPAPEVRPQIPQKAADVSQFIIQKPITFRYSVFILIATYLFSSIFGCFSIFSLQSPTSFLLYCGIFLVSLISIWTVSAKVVISEKGITASRMFGLSVGQMGWDEIAQIKSTAAGQVLELAAKNGHSLKVTSQVSGYPTIVRILQRKRPDLFNPASPEPSGGQVTSTGYESQTPTPAYTGAKSFRKSLLSQFGSYILIVPLFLVSVWAVFNEPEHVIGASVIGVICVFMLIGPFFDVSAVKVEGKKMTVETFFEEKELIAGQIKEIKIKSVRSRSRVSHHVVIVANGGKKYALRGFSEGTEILYGFLSNWWNTHRDQ